MTEMSRRLLLTWSIAAKMLACVASVSVWFRSKERPRNGILGFGRASNETRAKKMKVGGGGGEGRKRLQTNPSILKTCVRQRTQRLIGSASQTILTCFDQRFVSYWEVMIGTWHASSCGCCLFWSARFTFQCKSIFFNFFWNVKLFLRIYKGFRSFNLFSKVAFGSK